MRLLILGFGHPLRRDDSVGLRIIEDLALTEISEHADLVSCGTELINLLHLFKNRPAVVLIDAVDFKKPHGTILRRVCPGDDVTFLESDEIDSHGTNLKLCFSVLKLINIKVPFVLLYGIQPKEMGFGQELTGIVHRAKDRLILQLLQDKPWINPTLLNDVILYYNEDTNEWREK